MCACCAEPVPLAEFPTRLTLPLFVCSVRAGFPSPAEDYVEAPLDLNEHLVKHPAATFFVRAEGDWMRGAGIHSGDILIVDRSLPPSIGRVVVAAVDGQFTVKRLKRSPDGSVYLAPENDAYGAIPVRDESVQVWGVVTHVIHQP